MLNFGRIEAGNYVCSAHGHTFRIKFFKNKGGVLFWHLSIRRLYSRSAFVKDEYFLSFNGAKKAAEQWANRHIASHPNEPETPSTMIPAIGLTVT